MNGANLQGVILQSTETLKTSELQEKHINTPLRTDARLEDDDDDDDDDVLAKQTPQYYTTYCLWCYPQGFHPTARPNDLI